MILYWLLHFRKCFLYDYWIFFNRKAIFYWILFHSKYTKMRSKNVWFFSHCCIYSILFLILEQNGGNIFCFIWIIKTSLWLLVTISCARRKRYIGSDFQRVQISDFKNIHVGKSVLRMLYCNVFIWRLVKSFQKIKIA